MEIGEPKRTVVVEPLEDPVPREAPDPDPREAPPERVTAPAAGAGHVRPVPVGPV